MPSAQVGFIVGLFVQAIFYGIYIATLVRGLHWYLYKDKGQKLSKSKWAMTIVIIAIFMSLTIDLGIMVPMVLGYGPRTLPAISAAIEGLTICIVDAVLIYRCWVIHGYSWRIICFPLVLWCSCLVSMSFDIHYQLMTIGSPISEKLKLFRCAFFACHVATNVFATFAICYRILTVAKHNSSRHLSKLGYMLARSGVFFMLTSILNLIFGLIGFVPNLVVWQVTSDAINFSMAGITFNFILIRVGEERAKKTADGSYSSRQSQTKKSTLRFYATTVPCDSSCDSRDYA